MVSERRKSSVSERIAALQNKNILHETNASQSSKNNDSIASKISLIQNQQKASSSYEGHSAKKSDKFKSLASKIEGINIRGVPISNKHFALQNKTSVKSLRMDSAKDDENFTSRLCHAERVTISCGRRRKRVIKTDMLKFSTD